MYINGFLVPVPAEHKTLYTEAAGTFWEVAREHGALEHVEAWEVDVQDGHTTDFRCAVKLEPGEKVVFSWVIWPDQATAQAAEKAMMEDERMAEMATMPFDGKRMVFGGFEPILERRAERA